MSLYFLWLCSRICGPNWSEKGRPVVILGALPPSPRNLTLSGQNSCFGSTTMEALERRIGLRRNATRAPTQAPEWQGGFGRPNFLSPAVKNS